MSDGWSTSFLDTGPAVVQVPASNLWDGNDGPWSTFNIYVGTPPQSVRVLVSTCREEVWVVSANRTQGGCSAAGSPPDCPELQGGLVNVNASTTWNDSGNTSVDYGIALPDFDGIDAYGDTGTDRLGLGLPDSMDIKFQSQQIVAYALDYWYLGFLGVMGWRDAGSFSSESSFLSSLKDSNSTPSLTFAYSAGAKYRQNSTAVLTFGGFDASRFTPSSGISLPMNQTFSSPAGLTVGLNAVIMNNAHNTSLLPKSIQIGIEASIPHIWLPLEACSLFEEAFGIVYNSTVNRYLVNETLHRRLQSENPSVSFILGSNSTGGPTVNVTLPYGSFDLELRSPFVNDTQKYFPLRRADNETQYALGRTFLQEAYLVVDCERQNFSVYQNAWTSNAVPQLVPIPAVDDLAAKQNPRSSVSTAVLIATISICATIIFLMIEYRHKERVRRKLDSKTPHPLESLTPQDRKPELDAEGNTRGELHANGMKIEADGRTRIEMPASRLLELDGAAEVSELRGTEGGIEKG